MRIKERIYPYPVIKEEDSEYKIFKNASFDFSLREEFKENKFSIIIEIDDSSIPENLRPSASNHLSYGVQIESIRNKKRYFISKKEKTTIPIELTGDNYTGRVEINAYIYADSDFKIDFDTKRDGIDSFYQGPQEYHKGNIIAISRPTREINVQSNGQNVENPIRIVKENGLQDGIRYNIDESQIKISLNKDDYETYSKYGNDPLHKEFVLNALVVPAVSKALLEIEDFSDNCPWKNLFKSTLQASGVQISDIDESVTVEEATQIVLSRPLQKMFKELKKYGENN